PPSETAKSAQTAATRDSASAAIPPLSTFEGVYDSATRRPLYDAAPPATANAAAVDAAPEAPNVALHLIGTALEPGHSVAFFRTEGATVEVHAGGEKVGQAVITGIQRDSATVVLNGRPITLKVELAPVRPPALVPLIPAATGDQNQVIEVPPISTGSGPPPGTVPGPSDPP